MAAVPVMVTEAVFGPDVNTGGWERLAYAFPFAYGFVIAGDQRLQSATRRARWPALVMPSYQDVETAAAGHVIGEARLTGTYRR